MPRRARPDDSLTPIVQDSTPSLIATRLREAIATGVFGPGDQLGEAALAASFGVSRGPLREAMQRLTQEGLLVSHRNRGLFVMELDEAEITDMYLAREAIERAAVEQVITQGRAAEAASLLDIVREMRDPEPQGAASADMRWHVALVRLSGSRRLRAMHASLITQIRMCLTRMDPTFQAAEDRVAEHEALTRAIVAEDLELADRLMREHMRDGLERLGHAGDAAGSTRPPQR